MNTHTKLEIMTEVSWQLGDRFLDMPRAESRQMAVIIAQTIIDSGLITEDSEDIDEIINDYLTERKMK